SATFAVHASSKMPSCSPFVRMRSLFFTCQKLSEGRMPELLLCLNGLMIIFLYYTTAAPECQPIFGKKPKISANARPSRRRRADGRGNAGKNRMRGTDGKYFRPQKQNGPRRGAGPVCKLR